MNIINGLTIYDILIQRTHADVIKLLDRIYTVPTVAHVNKILHETFFDKYKYIPEKYDCNTFALSFYTWVRQEMYKTKLEYPLSIGVCGIHLDNGVYHFMNLAYTEGGDLLLIEPQNDKVEIYEGKNIIDFILI